MSIAKLEELLISMNIPVDSYSLDGGLPNEAFCIEKTDEKWHIYYSERGIKRTINYFDDESDAANALLEAIRKCFS